MVKLDLLNKKYNIREVICTLIDNDMGNFKDDYDFLGFLLSYYVGDMYNLEEKYKGFVKYEGLLPIMKLDEMGYFGKDMYKIYEICGKNKYDFIKTCDSIGLYGFRSRINKKTIDTNLKLKKPVSFYDDEIVLSNGKKVCYDINSNVLYRYKLDRKEDFEFNYLLEKSLRHRINESIIKNHDNIPLLDELPSFADKIEKEKNLEERRKFDKDFKYDINNLLFGALKYKLIADSNDDCEVREWFYDTNINFYNYHVLRLIPLGDYYFLDNNGRLYDFEQLMDTEKHFGEFIRLANFVNVRKIYENGISKLDENFEENEEFIMYANSYLEKLNTSDILLEEDLDNMIDITNSLYDVIYNDEDDGKKLRKE